MKHSSKAFTNDKKSFATVMSNGKSYTTEVFRIDRHNKLKENIAKKNNTKNISTQQCNYSITYI